MFILFDFYTISYYGTALLIIRFVSIFRIQMTSVDEFVISSAWLIKVFLYI